MVRWFGNFEFLILLVMVWAARSESWHFTGENIALNKSTEQRPGTWEGEFTDGVYITGSSDLAVDGNKANAFGNGSCSCTSGPVNTRASWSVDLRNTYFIKGVRIYTRGNVDLKYRYDNFEVLGYPSETTLHDDSTSETKLAREDVINIMVTPAQFNNITITVPPHKEQTAGLCFCEVEIYGVLDLNYCSSESTDDKLIWSVDYGFIDTKQNLIVVDSIINFSCQQHYTLIGTTSATCLSSGNFNASLPNCHETPCQAPSDIQNGMYTQDLKDNYSYYETMTWECLVGFKSDQNKTRQCLPTSTWSDTDPVCTLITCAYPSGFLNGELVFQNDTIYSHGNVSSGKIVYVRCEKCFTPNTETLNCTHDEVWSVTPQCTQVECMRLMAVKGGKYTYNNTHTQGDNYTCGTFAEVSRNNHFRVTVENRTCGQDGNWSGRNMQPCERICNAPPEIQYGSYKEELATDYPVGDILTWECSEGYKSEQNRTRQCLDTSSWSDSEPACTLITCAFPETKTNVSLIFVNGSAYTSESIPSKTVINVMCDECFAANVTSITCGLDEQWDNVPTCTRIVCDNLDLLPGGNYTYTDKHGNTLNSTDETYECGTVAEVYCGENYKTAAGNRTCGAKGYARWSGNDVPCVSLLGVTTNESPASSVPGAVIGGAVTAVVVLGVVAGITVFLILRRRRSGSQKSPMLAHDNHVAFSDVQDGFDNPAANECGPVTTEGTTDGEADMYYSFGDEPIEPPRAIRVSNLTEVVLFTESTEDRLMNEFKTFPEGMTKPHNDALQNRARNRYRDLYAYDDTRVVLDVWDPMTDTDYINACYIHGFNKPKAYIASQGPVKKILYDFWRMIWQTNCRGIVMLTNLNEAGKEDLNDVNVVKGIILNRFHTNNLQEDLNDVNVVKGH